MPELRQVLRTRMTDTIFHQTFRQTLPHRRIVAPREGWEVARCGRKILVRWDDESSTAPTVTSVELVTFEDDA